MGLECSLPPGDQLMEHFETLRVLVVESWELLQKSNEADLQQQRACAALVAAGTRTITPERLKQNKIPMVHSPARF